MPKQIIISEQHQIAAVFSEDQIQELVVATGHHQIGDIYLGVVENVLPGIDAAFVNIGDPERNGFIHVTDLGPLRLRRSAAAITELLVPQQKVLVQVMKEPTGTKGPRLTGNITMPGRYVVLMPYGRGVNLSRRIKSENERNRLRALAILLKPAGMGLLVRTEAEGKPEEAIIEDLEMLQKQWENILNEAQSTRAPALLNRDDDFIQRVLRDMYGADVNRIVVDSSTGLKRVKQYLQNWSGGQIPQGLLIDHHRDRSAILEYFRINAAIKEALKPRVDLPSGGYVIIQPTEALTVIDVNSGSFTRSATARETVLWTNCEAATEIARQLRLRNIAGVIVVDFIDMETRRDQLQVLEHFNKALRADKARPQIAQLTELGLVELTRKRQGQNIYELFGETCPTCNGLGHIVRLPGETEAKIPVPEKPSEAPERFVSLPQKELRVPTRIGSERSERGERSERLERSERIERGERSDRNEYDSGYGEPYSGVESDFGPTDAFISHPSYQEIGGDSTKRRVRRRRINGVPGKEESRIVGNSMNSYLNEPDLDDIEHEFVQSQEIPSPSIGKVGWGERERPKAKIELIKPVIEPPEIVPVEMTTAEQDVYAYAGVSPAVHLNREAKNPKSVIYNIVSPGESPAASMPPIAEPTITRRSPKIKEEAAQESEIPKRKIGERAIYEPEIDEPEIDEPEIDEPEIDEPEIEQPTLKRVMEMESETTASGIRRRRRRSSATEADD